MEHRLKFAVKGWEGRGQFAGYKLLPAGPLSSWPQHCAWAMEG